MARPLDPEIDAALEEATIRLLAEDGFARASVAAIAAAAGVGKPAVYRRHRNKTDLVAAALTARLQPIEVADHGDTHAELRAAATQGLPEDGEPYVALLGGLMAEHRRHPELIAAYRERVLAPRRAAVRSVIKRGQERGEVRRDLDPEAALDFFAGPFLARVFAGLDTGPEWRDRHFEAWWELVGA